MTYVPTVRMAHRARPSQLCSPSKGQVLDGVVQAPPAPPPCADHGQRNRAGSCTAVVWSVRAGQRGDEEKLSLRDPRYISLLLLTLYSTKITYSVYCSVHLVIECEQVRTVRATRLYPAVGHETCSNVSSCQERRHPGARLALPFNHYCSNENTRAGETKAMMYAAREPPSTSKVYGCVDVEERTRHADTVNKSNPPPLFLALTTTKTSYPQPCDRRKGSPSPASVPEACEYRWNQSTPRPKYHIIRHLVSSNTLQNAQTKYSSNIPSPVVVPKIQHNSNKKT